MRSPEQRNTYTRTGQNYDNESSRYKTPGAFTVLPPEEQVPPEPPMAPQPYSLLPTSRLTPSARRHKNLSFAILAEPSSAPGSRSPSPTGRVSPFRGRGFNPIGSRHVSPIPSPPPEGFSSDDSPRHSKIPRLSRRGSATAFGEKVVDYQSSPNRRKLNAQLSQSLTNIASKKVSNRPPASPRKPQGVAKAFQRLSPIVGSSPEPSQSQSSPKIPSTSTSKFTSPNRSKSFVNRAPRNPASRGGSRNVSREPSPSKTPTSPTRIPVKSYRNVQAKVNSFTRTKPKVPPKPQVLNEETTEESDAVSTSRRLTRRESVTSRSNSKSNLNSSSSNIKSKINRNVKDSIASTSNSKSNNSNKSNGSKGVEGTKDSIKIKDANSKTSDNSKNSSSKKIDSTIESSTEVSTQGEVLKKSESTVKLSDLLQPSTTTVVSSTTTTVTQPLKIEAKIDPESMMKSDNKTMAPMVDGHILSATSVSNAMNKMNDTVINSQTLMKETGLTKLTPAASSIIAMSKEHTKSKKETPVLEKKEVQASEKRESQVSEKKETQVSEKKETQVSDKKETQFSEKKETNPALDTKNATTALPTVEDLTNRGVDGLNRNHVTSTGIIPSARVLEQHVQNNMSKLIAPDSDHKMGNSMPKSANERMIEARTVVAHDVKPIKITVKEKPMDVEVQSGNIRFDTSNGLNERPGLPPPHQPSNDPQQESQEPPKGNVCTRFLTTCKKKMSCKRCKKEKNENKDEEELKKIEDDKETKRCFNCRKKKRQPDVTINVEPDPSEPKKTFWEKMKCCGKNKVGDTEGCFPTGKRKESWLGERRDSILSEIPTEKSRCSCCGGFFRKIFCLDRCRKKRPKLEQIQDSRRASMMSKKKSLSSSVPVEEVKPKIDASLVEHSSQMKAAIPVLPVGLAYFCLVMNCIAPGTGTIFSGMFCLCIGKPRFSQKDGARPRIWAFVINLVIGFGQFFTVLFCLVGWGWSIWWGIMMLKLAKKNRKIKALEANAQEGSRQVPAANHSSRDPERGS